MVAARLFDRRVSTPNVGDEGRAVGTAITRMIRVVVVNFPGQRV